MGGVLAYSRCRWVLYCNLVVHLLHLLGPRPCWTQVTGIGGHRILGAEIRGQGCRSSWTSMSGSLRDVVLEELPTTWSAFALPEMTPNRIPLLRDWLEVSGALGFAVVGPLLEKPTVLFCPQLLGQDET